MPVTLVGGIRGIPGTGSHAPHGNPYHESAAFVVAGASGGRHYYVREKREAVGVLFEVCRAGATAC